MNIKYLLYRLERMRTRNIAAAFFALCSFPVLAAGVLMRGRDYDLTLGHYAGNDNNLLFIVCIVISLFSLGALSLIFCANGILNFDYNFKRGEIDKVLSLPVKSAERFWSDFLSGLLPPAVFYTTGAALGLLVYNIFKNESTVAVVRNSVNPDKITGLLLCGLVFLIFSYCTVVFAVSLCGRMFETALFALLIAIVPPAVAGAMAHLLFLKTDGMVYIDNILFDIITVLSPLGFALGLFGSTDSTFYGGTAKALPVFRTEIMLPLILVMAGLAFSSLLISRVRKPEKAGEAFAVPFAYNIILGLGIFSVAGSIFGAMYEQMRRGYGLNAWDSVPALVIITALVFFIAEIIVQRGFRKIWKSMLRYFIMTAGSVAAGFVMIQFNGFGSAYYLPSYEEIESAVYCSRYYMNTNFYFNSFNFEIDADSEQGKGTAEYMWKMHEKSIGIKKEKEAAGERLNDYNYGYDYLTYKMKNGREVTRRLYMEQIDVYPVVTSRSYKEQQTAMFDELFYEDGSNWGFSLRPAIDYYKHNVTNYNIDEAEKELYEAIKTDYLEESETKSTGSLFVVSFNNYYVYEGAEHYYSDKKFYIQTSYKNTLAVLKKYGIEIPSYGENYFNDVSVTLVHSGYIAFTANSLKPLKETDIGKLLNSGDEKALALVNSIRLIEKIDGEGYVILAGNESYIIPAEFNTLAEEIFNEQVQSENVTVYEEDSVYERYYS